MKREELAELHFIVPMRNVSSILTHGILSNSRAAKFLHESVAMQEIQERRKRVTVPGGYPLHEYANLYLCARNPMLYLRRSEHKKLCILRISTDILDLPNVVITDQNASSSYVRFGRAPDFLSFVDREWLFAEYWTHPGDPIEQMRHKSVKCAEVLVPDSVHPRFITGAYVSCEESRQTLSPEAPTLNVTINPQLFFF